MVKRKRVKSAPKSVKPGLFFKLFYAIAIIFSLWSLVEAIRAFSIGATKISQLSPVYGILGNIFVFIMIVLSILAWVFFVKQKLPKISIVLPIYYLASIVLSFIFGVIFAVIQAMQGVPADSISFPIWYILISIILSTLELAFAVYVIYKLR